MERSRIGSAVPKTLLVSEVAMLSDPLPQIDTERCRGCHRCVDVCPTHALAQEGGKAFLRAPHLCVYCMACEDICPEGAIHLPFLIVLDPTARSTTDDSNSQADLIHNPGGVS